MLVTAIVENKDRMNAITMSQNELKILFLHGLDSSRESTKFHAIQTEKKVCIDMDYRNLNYATVADLYQEIIEKIKPDLLIGHSLGGLLGTENVTSTSNSLHYRQSKFVPQFS